MALRGPADRNRSDDCRSRSSVVGLGRLRNLRRFVGVCDVVQNRITTSLPLAVLSRLAAERASSFESFPGSMHLNIIS